MTTLMTSVIGDDNWDNQDNEKEWEWKSNPQTPLKGPLFQHLTLYTSLAITRLPNPLLSFTFMLFASSLRNQKLDYVIIIQNFPIDTQFNLHVMAIWIAWISHRASITELFSFVCLFKATWPWIDHSAVAHVHSSNFLGSGSGQFICTPPTTIMAASHKALQWFHSCDVSILVDSGHSHAH